MWMIWNKNAACLNYGQTVTILKEFPALGKCNVVAHGDEDFVVHNVPTSWLYRSNIGYANGTSYNDTKQ